LFLAVSRRAALTAMVQIPAEPKPVLPKAA
jgi:hypothetical protein